MYILYICATMCNLFLASEHASSLEISWQGQKLGLKNTHEPMGIWQCLVTINMLNLGIIINNVTK